MCGISVVCNPYYWQRSSTELTGSNRLVNVDEIRRSLDLLEHRGPDDKGILTSSDGRAGLGHVRLSIIDLEGGHQPLTDTTGTVHCVVAGELYDYARLRFELEKKGTVFKTNSDSELVLGLYEHYGVDLLRHLRGEFTFALYDNKRSLLFAARDRFGIKPLYYTFSEGRLLIANEIKAFMGYGWKAQWDLDSIVNMGEYGDDRTVFQGVRKLVPGHCITYDRSDRFQISCYWDQIYPSQDPAKFQSKTNPGSVEEAVSTVRQLLIEAVQTRLRSDVPLAFYLSGGIDSAAVAGIAAKLLKEQNHNAVLHTFTLAFPSRADVDEGPRARRQAERIGATVHMIEPTEQELVDQFEDCVYHTESPLTQLMGAGKAILSKAVRDRGFKVVLTGEGSDETFAGYSLLMSDFLRQPDHLAEHMFGIPLPTAEDRAHALQAMRLRPGQDLISLADFSALPKPSPTYKEMLGGVMPPWIMALLPPNEFFAPKIMEKYGPPNPYDLIAQIYPPQLRDRLASGDCHGLHGALYMANKSSMVNLNLNQLGDRTEMINSIEGRPPFLDHKLVEYANSLPPSMKIRPLLNSGSGGGTESDKWTYCEKWILREAVKPFVTEEIYLAKKSQYNVSVNKTTSSLTSQLTPLQTHLRYRITQESIKHIGLFEWPVIEKTLNEFLERPESPLDGGLDRNGRRLLFVLSLITLQERFNIDTI